MRVGILSLVHESNTFAVTPTTIDLFQRDGLFTGEAVREEFAGGLHQITGFMDGLDETGIEAVPVFYASTSPSGTITVSPSTGISLSNHVRWSLQRSRYSQPVLPPASGISNA